MRIKLAKEARNTNRNYNNIYGFMVLKGGPYVFKIYDETRETKAITLEAKKSKRSEVKGKECSHHKSYELEDLSKKLEIRLNDKQKRNVCYLMDYYLREYDLKRKNGKRWFINSIEGMRNAWVKSPK